MGKDWSTYFQLWGWAIAEDVRLGSVAMLTIMTAPLAWGMLLYQVYLIWAGMTTNESQKWGDWRDDVADGIVFKGQRSANVDRSRLNGPEVEPKVVWPIQSDQLLLRIESETEFPSTVGANGQINKRSDFVNVNTLREVDNIYDLGFWDNFRDILRTA